MEITKLKAKEVMKTPGISTKKSTFARDVALQFMSDRFSGMPVIDDEQFSERTEKLPLNVGLFLKEETRNYIISGKRTGTPTFNFQVGEAFETSVVESLKKVFQSASIVNDRANIMSNIERIVTISFGNASKIWLGRTTFSEHTSEIELNYEVYDNKWNLLWKRTAQSKVGKTAGGSAGTQLLFGAFGQAAYNNALGRIVNESLTAALEQMNEQILTSGREAILKGVPKE